MYLSVGGMGERMSHVYLLGWNSPGMEFDDAPPGRGPGPGTDCDDEGGGGIEGMIETIAVSSTAVPSTTVADGGRRGSKIVILEDRASL
jgi:hypothetical protein